MTLLYSVSEIGGTAPRSSLADLVALFASWPSSSSSLSSAFSGDFFLDLVVRLFFFLGSSLSPSDSTSCARCLPLDFFLRYTMLASSLDWSLTLSSYSPSAPGVVVVGASFNAVLAFLPPVPFLPEGRLAFLPTREPVPAMSRLVSTRKIDSQFSLRF